MYRSRRASGAVGLNAGLPIQTITQNKHAHYKDRAAFTYFVNGHYFFRPSGYFRFDTAFKNTLTFDGRGQSVDPDTGGEITGVYRGENDVYSAARCEAAPAYPEVPGLSAFERTVLHARDRHVVFVLDRVRFSGPETRPVEAHFHVGHEVETRIHADGSLRLQTPSGQACRLFQASSRAAAFERVPQPVDPYWKEYLSGYDIPPEDLEAMDQVDLRFRFEMAGETSLDVLWAILPFGADCVAGQRAEGSMISFWYAVPGGAPQLVLAPPVEEVARSDPRTVASASSGEHLRIWAARPEAGSGLHWSTGVAKDGGRCSARARHIRSPRLERP